MDQGLFLAKCPQKDRLGPHLASSLTLIICATQGNVLSSLFYSFYTYDCVPVHPKNTILKFADDTTVVGLISNGDQTAYKDEIANWQTGIVLAKQYEENQKTQNRLQETMWGSLYSKHQRKEPTQC